MQDKQYFAWGGIGCPAPPIITCPFKGQVKNPKAKYKIPYFSKNKTQRYCIVARVAFAARTSRHKRIRNRSRTHRRRTQTIRSRLVDECIFGQRVTRTEQRPRKSNKTYSDHVLFTISIPMGTMPGFATKFHRKTRKFTCGSSPNVSVALTGLEVGEQVGHAPPQEEMGPTRASRNSYQQPMAET